MELKINLVPNSIIKTIGGDQPLIIINQTQPWWEECLLQAIQKVLLNLIQYHLCNMVIIKSTKP
jgi:hypothetical protein